MRHRRTRRAILALIALAGATACNSDRDQRAASGDRALPVSQRPAEPPARFALGTPAAPAVLAAMNLDANAAGVGLPPGRGTPAEGAAVYASRCAKCHGARGEGMASFPPIVGPPFDSAFRFGADVKLVKTPGNYWPYATTLYDYIRRTMPFDAPGSLQPNEIYGLVAFLLAENHVVERTAVMDARTLPAVRMPARDRFVRDDRTGGPGFR